MKKIQRMPGTSLERPRTYKLTELEPHTVKAGCSRGVDNPTSPLGTSASSSMGSVARFPKLDECAHFHYEHVELGKLEVSISGDPDEEQQSQSSISVGSGNFAVRVTSGDACWILQRSYDNFIMFDRQLHRCIFDRNFSQLNNLGDEAETNGMVDRLREYLNRFSALNHEGLNCGPVLNWLQLDNRGRRILVPEADSCPINTPAVAAAYAVRPYQAQAQDEISFQVGDMISVIDMPPAGESTWWRGKHGFAVGFFPAECVAVIGDKLPRHLAITAVQQRGTAGVDSGQPVKPVLRKHGKLIAFFRSFILNRPSRRRLKQSGILRERVFGCDLGEHLLNSARDVPRVLTCCAEFIERHGLVDGIYRLSGVTSNIQRLRHAFDEDRVPALHSDEGILQDIHSVASLLKMYFRELPNPLCTYQLYSSFVSAVQSSNDSERLERMRDAVRKLPPPHYRTLEYLMRHLVRVAARGEETGMTPRNVAIVWAPNLLRCKELEVGGVAALQGVGVQAVVTEFLICYAELIFATGPSEATNLPVSSGQRPKSLAIASNSARLLSLEEARNRSLLAEPELIEVGAGAAGLPPHYHTIIELPHSQRKRNGSKRSPSLNWRALFGGKTTAGPPRLSSKVRAPEPSTAITMQPNPGASAPRLPEQPTRLRPAKSADSLEGGQEDALGPLLAPGTARTCGHSRSVSHDSYFEHLGETGSAPGSGPCSGPGSGSASGLASGPGSGPTSEPTSEPASGPDAPSPLDLSEIQLSFELEERELRMLSGEDSARHSLEASPRRQRSLSCADSPSDSQEANYEPNLLQGQTLAGSNGRSKRKRSRLEERLHCDLELRFIDSQSPDQVMVSAEVHEMESPSPLATPGYLPLLSESSTPLTPTPSPAAISPRISFRSFLLPLEVNERTNDTETELNNKTGLLQSSICSSEPLREKLPCYDLDAKQTNRMSEPNEKHAELSSNLLDPLIPQRLNFSTISNTPEIVDHEMTPCDKLLNLDTSNEMNEDTYHGLKVSSIVSSILPEIAVQHPDSEILNLVKIEGTNELRVNPELLLNADLDSLMPYEQNILDDTVERTSTFKSDNIHSEEWLVTNSPSDLTNTCNENESQKSLNENTTGDVTKESSSNTPKDHDSALESSYFSSTNAVPSDELQNSGSIKIKIELSNKVDETNRLQNAEVNQLESTTGFNLTSLNVETIPTDYDSHNNESNESLDNNKCDILQNNTNNQCDQIKIPMDNWNAFLNTNNMSMNNQTSHSKDLIQHQNIRVLKLEESNNYQQTEHDAVEKNNFNKGIIVQNSECENISISSNEYNSEIRKQESNSIDDLKAASLQEDLDVVIPSESAAVEPQEMAHVPSENLTLNSNSISSSNISNQDSAVNKDTAAILQELALQRLSGNDRMDTLFTRKRYDCDFTRDRRSFDSEIGREIVREHKMKQELANARSKMDESLTGNNQLVSTSHLPPCLRARHARASRAALSRSLDEAKFNKMTSGYSGVNLGSGSCIKRNKGDLHPHGSTPNVGSKVTSQPGITERSTQSLNKNLGLDLDDPRCRERIEKYKEERRTFLRDKYRSESFRAACPSAAEATSNEKDEEQALLARLKQRASKPSLL